MKSLASLLLTLLLFTGVSLAADDVSPVRKPYVLYAQFLQETRVELSDGAVWMMDKGDCFPIHMFKEHQTKVVLKLASATFLVDAVNLKVLPDRENENALESYRKNLAQYLNNQPDVWKEAAKTSSKKERKEKEPSLAPEKKAE